MDVPNLSTVNCLANVRANISFHWRNILWLAGCSYAQRWRVFKLQYCKVNCFWINSYNAL